MKLHKITASFGVPTLLGSFLTPVKVAPVLFVLGLGLMGVSIMLITIQRYEEGVIERHNRERRKFE